jgi:hypothetical protein
LLLTHANTNKYTLLNTNANKYALLNTNANRDPILNTYSHRFGHAHVNSKAIPDSET